MRFTSTTSTTQRSALVTSSKKVTESSALRSERKYPPKELAEAFDQDLDIAISRMYVYYTEKGSIVIYQTRSSKSWLT